MATQTKTPPPITHHSPARIDPSSPLIVPSSKDLAARTEVFDSFWEAPENTEKGFKNFGKFYRANYMPYVPADKQVSVLVISCGPGYMVNVLNEEGYHNVLGIDSFPDKVEYARFHGLNCEAAHAFEFLDTATESYDVIFCEQELNHLTKDEMIVFLRLCWKQLNAGGTLIVHGLNGANPITGAEALAQNIDHFNTFTAYSLEQVLTYCNFSDAKAFPLKLYVFYSNPLNYVGMAITSVLTLMFQIFFKLYGKFNRIFTKKLGAVATKPH